MTSEYHPDPNPEVENARRAWLEIRATARHQLEAMGGVPETGTEAGERYRLLQWDTTHAYIRYLDTRTAAYPPKADSGAPRLPDSPSNRMDVWKGEVIAPTEEELLSRIQG